MNGLPKRLNKRTVTLILVLGLIGALPIILLSCDTFRNLEPAVDALLNRSSPDYDAIESDRAAHGKANWSLDTSALSPWPGYRGPRRDGVVLGDKLKLDWETAEPKRLWRQPVGGGHASFAVADSVAFTIEQRRDQEVVTAYRISDGWELWAYRYNAKFYDTMGGVGPRATPAYRDGKVITLGATGILTCIDATEGSKVWQRDVLEDANAVNLTYGIAGSPLIIGDKVIVQAGMPNEEGNTTGLIRAYRLKDGDLIWSTLPERQSYASPMLFELGDEKHVLVNTANDLVALNPENGKQLWSVDWKVSSGLACAQPLMLGNGRIMLSGGYGSGAIGIEITRSDDGYDVKQIWRSLRMKNKYNSSVYHEGYIYGLDEGRLTCLNASDGKLKWRGERLGYGQVMLAQSDSEAGDWRLIVVGGRGMLHMVAADPDGYREIASTRAFDAATWSVPAYGNKTLLLRNTSEMTAYDLGRD